MFIGDLLPNIEKPLTKSERAEIVSFFITEINKERPCRYLKDGKWKVANKIESQKEKANIAIRLAVLKSKEELREFFKICVRYRKEHGSFSRRFYGGFKKQKFYEKNENIKFI